LLWLTKLRGLKKLLKGLFLCCCRIFHFSFPSFFFNLLGPSFLFLTSLVYQSSSIIMLPYRRAAEMLRWRRLKRLDLQWVKHIWSEHIHFLQLHYLYILFLIFFFSALYYCQPGTDYKYIDALFMATTGR
jgi:hypothetical protein